jgi:hypothetical protein
MEEDIRYEQSHLGHWTKSIPYARKARKVPLAAVDKEFGWRQPIVVDAREGIICGHTRWLAAQKPGLTEGTAGARGRESDSGAGVRLMAAG